MTPRVRRYAYEAALQAGVAPSAVLSKSRVAPVCRARWAVMKRLRADGFSLPQIGAWLGRDHTTVLHGLRTS